MLLIAHLAGKVDEVQESLIDFAESQLMKNIKAGKEASIFFFLKCKGKKRGYIEKREFSIESTIEQKIKNMTPAQRESREKEIISKLALNKKEREMMMQICKKQKKLKINPPEKYFHQLRTVRIKYRRFEALKFERYIKNQVEKEKVSNRNHTSKI